MNVNPHKLTWRILVGVGLPLGLLAILIPCLLLQRTPPCVFYQLTGLHCFGCGAGRAFLALSHLDLALALRNNSLLILSAPFLFYCALKYYIAFVFGRDLLPFPAIRGRFFGIFVLAVMLAFVILRNIPIYPFTLLAPVPPA